jgi:hypothetical protein
MKREEESMKKESVGVGVLDDPWKRETSKGRREERRAAGADALRRRRSKCFPRRAVLPPAGEAPPVRTLGVMREKVRSFENADPSLSLFSQAARGGSQPASFPRWGKHKARVRGRPKAAPTSGRVLLHPRPNGGIGPYGLSPAFSAPPRSRRGALRSPCGACR